MWDYFYPPPDIQVIQPTPKTSPCPSERIVSSVMLANEHRNGCCVVSKNKATAAAAFIGLGNMSSIGSGSVSGSCSSLPIANRRRKKPQKSLSEQDSFDYIGVYSDAKKYDEIEEEDAESIALAEHIHRLNRNNRLLESSQDTLNSSLAKRRAPLASLSSFKISSVDYQDSDLRSLGSDSVFVESYADTDDDMEQFSTDSNEENDALCPPHTRASRSMAVNRSATFCADIEMKPREKPGAGLMMHSQRAVATEYGHLTGDHKYKSLFKSTQSMQSQRSAKARLDHERGGAVARGATGSAVFTSQAPPPATELFAMKSTQRPASYSGCTATTNQSLHLHSGSSSGSSNNLSNNNRNDNNIHFINDNNRNSKSTSNMIEGLMLSSRCDTNVSTTTSSTAPPFAVTFAELPCDLHSRQMVVLPLDDHGRNSQGAAAAFAVAAANSGKYGTTKVNCTCTQSDTLANTNIVASNIVDNRQRQSIVSPSVILELPVIVSTQEQLLGNREQQRILDSNVTAGSSSHKRSKETLF